MRQLNNKHLDTTEGASALPGEIVSSQFAPSCQKDENQMKIVTKKMERELIKAVNIISDVRNEITKREKADGIKRPMGVVLGFTLDGILEDLDFLKEGE
tara:strand:+ start:10113 stop:10409 length:297 start_codon:yes stop_codon:yes gene_type:complete